MPVHEQCQPPASAASYRFRLRPARAATGSGQPGDTSDALGIAGSDALVLNGSTIRRVSTFPSQAANLSLLGGRGGDTVETQTSGLSGFSLRGGDGGSSPVVVDCSEAPVVENVTATAFAGEYGAGQRIYFQV